MAPIDYKSFGPKAPVNTEVNINRWWTANRTDLAGAVQGIIKTLANYDTVRLTQYNLSAKLYGNLSLIGLNGLSYSRGQTNQTTLKDRISYNVIKSTIDTISSKIAKNKPDPMFLTSGGDYKKQRRSKKLDKFVDGIFYENDVYKLGVDAFRDACVFGDGIIHVFNDNGRVKYERVIPSELYVDSLESFYGHPRQLHRVKAVDREVLIDMFPEHKASIKDANSLSADLAGMYQNVSDQVVVTESWHLPSGPGANDGLHTITIPGKSLLIEDYEKQFFPFARLQWSKRLYGPWGQGLAEEIQNIQLEINKILWVIQRSMHMAGTFKILMENGSKIVKEHFTNDIGLILTYTNTKPEYVVPPIVPMEYYQHFITLKSAAFEQAGVSMLSAASLKPAGLDSGKALREYNDIESDRFMLVGQAYERFYMDIAKLSISVAKDIYGSEKSYEVKIPGKRFIESIDWKDIDLEEDEYVMKIYPVSSLPNDPAGSLQTVQEYMQAGLISQRTGKKLLEFPDIEQEETLSSAAENYLLSILDKIVDEEIYTAPEPRDDLKLARELALEYYALGKTNGLESEKLEMLGMFLDQITILEVKAMAPPVPVPGQEPLANPVQAPTSELVPNVNLPMEVQ